MKICFFGGSFDPIHLGHSNIIDQLLLKFDRVIVMPAKQSPSKNLLPKASSYQRMDMLQMSSFAKNNNCIISDYELTADTNKNYTINSIRHISEEFKSSNIYMAIGLDQLNDLNNWYKSDALLGMVNIICFNRSSSMSLKTNNTPIQHEFVENFNYDISSSKIRKFISNNNKSVLDMIDKNVFEYIKAKKLYK